jgi:hypothetical protein
VADRLYPIAAVTALTIAALLASASGYPVTPALGAGARMEAAARASSPTRARERQSWSAARVLARCALPVGPQVTFPSEGPTSPTGDGAISWLSRPAPCASRFHAQWDVSVAALGAADRALPAHLFSFASRPAPALEAVGASFGHIALITADAGGTTELLEGASSDLSAWSRTRDGAGPPLVLARAYLGDVALAGVDRAHRITVRVERHYQSAFGPPISIPAGVRGAVTALTVAVDYRADMLVAWQRHGSIYARILRASGRVDAAQRVGASAAHPQLQAVFSDNGHAMIAWAGTELRRGSTPRTRIELSLSQAGGRFGPPRLLASFADPERVGRRPGSLALVRLATENVLLAWTVAERGRYAIWAAPAVFAGTRPATLLSDGSSEAVLDELAPGPAGEAVALWGTAPRLVGGELDEPRTQLWAARVSIRPHSRVVLADAEVVAPPGPKFAPALAVDPANDRAIAAWLVPGTQPQVEYAVAGGPAADRVRAPVPALASPATGVHWLRVTLAAIVLALAAVALAIRWRRRRV